MFEVVPSLTRGSTDVRSLFFRRLLGAAALLSLAALGACCGASGDSETPRTPVVGGGEVSETAPDEQTEPDRDDDALACLARTWITPPDACACPPEGSPEYTVECAAADCYRCDVLVLRRSGEALAARVRFSARRNTLSAIGGAPLEGEWRYFDDGELMLSFDGNAKYTPTECDPEEQGELQPKGEQAMSRPPPALLSAITKAADTGLWTEVPYRP